MKKARPFSSLVILMRVKNDNTSNLLKRQWDVETVIKLETDNDETTTPAYFSAAMRLTNDKLTKHFYYLPVDDRWAMTHKFWLKVAYCAQLFEILWIVAYCAKHYEILWIFEILWIAANCSQLFEIMWIDAYCAQLFALNMRLLCPAFWNSVNRRLLCPPFFSE